MNPKPVVVHVYKDCFPPVVGGIEKHIALLRDRVTGVRSKVLCCSGGWRTQFAIGPNGEPEVRAGELGRILSAPLAPRMPSLLAAIEADVIHLHAPNPTGEVAALIGRRGRPLVLSYHADIVRQGAAIRAYKPLLRAVARRAHRVVVGSAAMSRSPFLAGIPEERVTQVPYGVDTDWYDARHVPSAEVERLHERYGGPFAIAVGRLVHYKGFEHLIDASRTCRVPVVIAGDGPQGPELRRRAQGLADVHLAGRLSESDLRAHLAAAAVFVLPSTNRAESFGIATLEAQAMGLPAVVTDVGTGTA